MQETQILSLIWEDPWRRKWQPTPVFLPGKSHGQRSLAGYSPWCCRESDTTEQPSMHTREEISNLQTQGLKYPGRLFFSGKELASSLAASYCHPETHTSDFIHINTPRLLPESGSEVHYIYPLLLNNQARRWQSPAARGEGQVSQSPALHGQPPGHSGSGVCSQVPWLPLPCCQPAPANRVTHLCSASWSHHKTHFL